MRWVMPLVFACFFIACIESNPQPAPGKGGDNETPTNLEGDKDVLPGDDRFGNGSDAGKFDPDPDAIDGAMDALGEMDSEVLFDLVETPDVSADMLEDAGSDTVEPEDVADQEDNLEADAEAPTDVAPGDVAHGASQVRGGGSFFGECWGACKQDVTIAGTAVKFVASNWDDTIYVDNDGVLTAAGLARSQELAVALIGVELEDVYGCPDCADGGGFYLMLERDGVESKHTYPFGQPFTSLTECDTFIKDLMTALAGCQSTEYITVGADCGPLG